MGARVRPTRDAGEREGYYTCMAQGTHSGPARDDDVRRANPIGALVTLVGSVLLLISIWFDWVGLGPSDDEQYFRPGYEADSVIPFMALLGIGFSAALLYAMKQADRRQHRGPTLASFAVGLASLLWILLFLIDPISTLQYAGADGEANPNVTTSWAVWLGLIGALLWTVGSALLAKEPEGDVERSQVHYDRPVQTQHVTDVRHTDHTEHLGTHDVRSHEPGHPVTGTGTGTTGTTGTGTGIGTGTDRAGTPPGSTAGRPYVQGDEGTDPRTP